MKVRVMSMSHAQIDAVVARLMGVPRQGYQPTALPEHAAPVVAAYKLPINEKLREWLGPEWKGETAGDVDLPKLMRAFVASQCGSWVEVDGC